VGSILPGVKPGAVGELEQLANQLVEVTAINPGEPRGFGLVLAGFFQEHVKIEAKESMRRLARGAQISQTAWKLDGCEPDSRYLLMSGAPVDALDRRIVTRPRQFVRGRMRKNERVGFESRPLC
jgi:hypothetical protein